MAFLKVDPGGMKFVIQSCFIVPYDEIDIDKIMDSTSKSWHMSILTAALYLLAVYGSQRIINVSVFNVYVFVSYGLLV